MGSRANFWCIYITVEIPPLQKKKKDSEQFFWNGGKEGFNYAVVISSVWPRGVRVSRGEGTAVLCMG